MRSPSQHVWMVALPTVGSCQSSPLRLYSLAGGTHLGTALGYGQHPATGDNLSVKSIMGNLYEWDSSYSCHTAAGYRATATATILTTTTYYHYRALPCKLPLQPLRVDSQRHSCTSPLHLGRTLRACTRDGEGGHDDGGVGYLGAQVGADGRWQVPQRVGHGAQTQQLPHRVRRWLLVQGFADGLRSGHTATEP